MSTAEAEQAEKLYPGPKDFCHLHAHTTFSPLDGVAKPAELFERAQEYEHTALAVTDHGQLSAFPDSFFASKETGVKFIPGCEIYYNDYHREFRKFQEDGGKMRDLDPEIQMRYRRNRHLTVLSKNMRGYRNLIHVTTEAWEIGFYYKPRIWFDQLEKHREGLVILSGCLNGPVCHELRMAAEADAEGLTSKSKYHTKIALRYILRFREVFGDDYYLEAQMPGPEIPWGKEAFFKIMELSRMSGIPACITNDVHYLDRRDFQLQKVMMSISQGVTVDSPNLFHVNSDEQYYKSRAELRQTFIENGYGSHVTLKEFETACDNTVRVAETCTGFKPNLDPKLPEIDNAETKLRQAVERGLRDRGLWDLEERFEVDGKKVTYQEQADIELQRFHEKEFDSYFLITEDLVNYSRRNGWDTMPGRGSAGGSLVCYALGITEMDPLKWGLSFNRFLSPSRGGYMLKVTME